MRVGLMVSVLLMVATVGVAVAQVPRVDPNWVYVTAPAWRRTAGAPPEVKTRYSDTILVILYPTGLYAEAAALLIKSGRQGTVGLDLNEGFIVRVGAWARTDDNAIRITSHEAFRDKVIQAMKCDKTGANCQPVPDPKQAGETTRTCGLAGRSRDHLAAKIVCRDMVVSPPRVAIDLADLPQMMKAVAGASVGRQ